MGWGRPAEGAGDEQVEAGGGSRTGRENRSLILSEGRWWGRERTAELEWDRIRAWGRPRGQRQRKKRAEQALGEERKAGRHNKEKDRNRGW